MGNNHTHIDYLKMELNEDHYKILELFRNKFNNQGILES